MKGQYQNQPSESLQEFRILFYSHLHLANFLLQLFLEEILRAAHFITRSWRLLAAVFQSGNNLSSIRGFLRWEKP